MSRLYDPTMSSARMRRIVIVGAGAIGGAVGARVFESGADVTLVARGAHAAVIAADGLTLVEPDREITVPVPVVTSVGDAAIGPGTVVALAVKPQDAPPVLAQLATAAPAAAPVACFQ